MKDEVYVIFIKPAKLMREPWLLTRKEDTVTVCNADLCKNLVPLIIHT